MYHLLRSFLFLFDPEWAHYFSMNCLRFACSIQWLKKLIAKHYSSETFPSSTYRLLNLSFKNPVGLGAGFDKNAKYLTELEALGFGFIEIGTVTPLPQPGNDKPRLFRLPEDKALINRMGFNNDGVAIVAERLRKWKSKNSKLIIGGNIGKNKDTLNEDAWKDYEACFVALHAEVDYFVVNVSSPNTVGLRDLQEKKTLHKILTNLQAINNQKEKPKPILLKISPDLSREQMDNVIDLAIEIKLDGLVAANTTLDRSRLGEKSKVESQKNGAGGLSGLPLKEKSTDIIKYIHQRTKGQIPVIGSGGIFTGADAKEKITAGASLVQVWTGFIYEGPGIAKKISAYLANNPNN